MPYCDSVALAEEQLDIARDNAQASTIAAIGGALAFGGIRVAAIPGGLTQIAGGVLTVTGTLLAVGGGIARYANEWRSVAVAERLAVCEHLKQGGYVNNSGYSVQQFERSIELTPGLVCEVKGTAGSSTYSAAFGWDVTASTLRVDCKPIILDLDGDGIEWVNADTRIAADLDGTGFLTEATWVRPDDGILVFDQNNDNLASRAEWVLTRYIPGAQTDLEALRGFDSNNDGVFDALDKFFVQFKIGRDLNQNGKFDAGELFTFAQLGIQSIKVESGLTAVGTLDQPHQPVEGVNVYSYGQFVRTNGSLGSFADASLSSYALPTSVEEYGHYVVLRNGATATYVANTNSAHTVYLNSSLPHFVGADGSDSAYGDAGKNLMAGGGGVDLLYGGDGDDTVIADSADLSWGAAQGDAGHDMLVINDQTGVTVDAFARSFEVVIGGNGSDYLYNSATAYDTTFDVTLAGGAGNDTLLGGGSSDTLVGGEGVDSMNGGAGDDTIVIDRHDNLANVRGGSQSHPNIARGDTIVIGDTIGLTLSNLYQLDFEQAIGGTGSDTIYAGRTDGDFYREKRDNTLAGGEGNDFIYGGPGADIYNWNPGDGHDTFSERDYGEIEGDMIVLGHGVTINEVTIQSTTSTGSKITITGADGGSITLLNWSTAYVPANLLAVDGKVYDLRAALSQAGNYGYAGMPLTAAYPLPPTYFGTSGGGTGTGGGGGGGGGTGGGGGGPGGGGDIPPIVLDLDGDGFDLISFKDSKTYFDWDGDGAGNRTGWVGKDDGLLVIDRDGDGDITRADEISFGVAGTKKGSGFVSDLEGLRSFDSNGNDSLDSGDAEFHMFRVWRDADSDAVVDDGELLTLEQVGFEALSLTGYLTGDKLERKDNDIYAVTDVVFADGSSGYAADVLFAWDAKGKAPKADVQMFGEDAHIVPTTGLRHSHDLLVETQVIA